jgi:hypothetical protein
MSGTYHGASAIMRRTFLWKRSSIWMLEMEDLYSVGPYGFEDDFMGQKFVALESLGLRPNSQYILESGLDVCLGTSQT